MQGKLFILSAPSGAGKTTLMHRVLKELENKVHLERVITYTTKQPRTNEIDGFDYHFISRDTFDELLQQGFFLEYSKAYVDYYGSPASIIEELNKGVSYIIIVDRIGAQDILKKVPDAVTIWIEAPSMEELKLRLISRATETPEKIERRLLRAHQEIDLEKKSPLYAYHMVNDDIEQTVLDLKAIIGAEIAQKTPVFGGKTGTFLTGADTGF